MIRQLTLSERPYAVLIPLLMAMAGIAMSVFGKSDPLGIHGVIVVIFSGVLLWFVLPSTYAPEPNGSTGQLL